jgi:hypothetical protein
MIATDKSRQADICGSYPERRAKCPDVFFKG